MAPQTRHRARSSVDNLFDLVENLEEDQLQNLLDELNSTPHEPNIDVTSGVAYFEEQRRRDVAAAHKLRPTPSFLNEPHEPADWPRQKPRPVSGSQWRQSMRIVSAPYSTTRTNTAPISPPLTASPPSSPPGGMMGRRSMTAPVVRKIDTAVEVTSVPSPISPPRTLAGSEAEEEESHTRPSLTEFGAFSFGGDGAADERYTSDEEQASNSSSSTSGGISRPVSPTQAAKQQLPVIEAAAPPPPQMPSFSRISTMPALSAAPHMRPRTATGHAVASVKDNPRAFRRISRPQFLSPMGAAAPADDLAQKLMGAFLFGDVAPPTAASSAVRRESGEKNELEAMLKEPASPRSRFMFGRVEREAPPVSGIFQVLNEG